MDLQKYKLLGKRVSVYALYLALTFGLSYWMFWATGEPRKNILALALSIPISLLIPTSIGFWCVLAPMVVMIAVYSPVAHLYGPPNYERLLALVGTDRTEAWEFVTLIPPRYYIFLFGILLTLFLIRLFAKINKISLLNNRTYLFVAVVFLIYLANPLHFFGQVFSSVREYKALSEVEQASSWPKSSTDISNKDYVLIIGESARKDYFQIFGYPLNDNPFLSKANIVAVDGLFSGGTHTAFSLSKMLTAGSNWMPRYDRTFVDLAKSAGIQTIWITNNQLRAFGPHDTPLTLFSRHADKAIHVSAESNDLELLDYFSPELDREASSSRLFIVHTRGSHPDVCERVKGMRDKYEATSNLYSYIACYASSIKQTDKLIQRIYEVLRNHQNKTLRPFSIIYFSDHGLKTIKENGKILLTQGDNFRGGFEIPLLKIDSESTERKYFKTVKSGLKFTEGLANWMHINNPEIKYYNLFDGVSDNNDYGLDQLITNRDVDIAIDISKHIKDTNAIK